MRSVSLREDFLVRARATLDRVDARGGQFTRYAEDAAGFMREVLGVEPWSSPIVDEIHGGGQQRILEAVPDEQRISIQSGNGIGKTMLAAAVAWWFLKVKGEGSRVFLTSTKGDQTQLGVWHEARKMFRRAQARGYPLGREIPKLGKTGWEGLLGEQMMIVTADKAEALQSLRAEPGKTMFIADEASGIEDRLFEAIEGNLSAGGWLFLIGNPTRSSGYFFDSQKDGSGFFRMQIPSYESPYVDKGWIERMRKKYGEDHPVYIIRVKGEALRNEEGRPLPWVFIEQAQLRYRRVAEGDHAGGVLSIGVDPAGPGKFGDETAMTAVRGNRFVDQIAGAGWDEDTIIRALLDFIAKWRGPDELVRVIVDAEGPIGGSLYGRLLAIAKSVSLAKRFVVFGVRASEKARREPHVYTRVRDELFANVAKWVKAEGELWPDDKLAKELHEPLWHAVGDRGLLKLTDKDELRKLLDGRSPDRADSLSLAVWIPANAEDLPPAPPPPPQGPETQNAHRTHELKDRTGRGFYGSLDWARPRNR